VDPDIAGKMVGENNTELFSWYWPGEDDSILPRVKAIIQTTSLSIVNAATAGLPDLSQNILVNWGCGKERNGYGGPYARIVTPIFWNNTAAGQVKAAMKLINATIFLGYLLSPNSRQTSLRGGCSFLSQDDILPPPAEDMIEDIREESDHDGDRWRPNRRSFPMTNTAFEKFEPMLPNRIIRQQRYLEVIRNCALGPIADHEQILFPDEDVASLHMHDSWIWAPRLSIRVIQFLHAVVDHILGWRWEVVIWWTVAAATTQRRLGTSCATGLLVMLNNPKKRLIV
jgi:hypothetical protein